MGLISVRSRIARKLLVLALAMALVLGWSATANAQTSSDSQYGDPMSSGQEAIESSSTASGSGAASDPGSVAAAGVLPDTGGSVLPFLALGTLALSSTGLLMLRHNSRR